MAEFVDVHTHLEMPEFEKDLEETIKRAKDSSVTFICTVGTEPRYWDRAKEIATNHKNIYFSIGLHPHEATQYDKNIEKSLLNYLSEDKCLMLGEIGLDFFKNYSPKEKQIAVFQKQLDIAEELNKPVMIHIREAHKEAKEILKKRDLSGIIHCFSGTLEDAKFYIDLGYFISIPGTVTFKKAANLAEVVKTIPLDYILTETDAPFLAPEPYRGKRNEPAFVVQVTKKISELKNLPLEDVARTIKINTEKIFGLNSEKKAKLVYKIRNSLYINLTNRCSNRCVFCGKNRDFFVKGHYLKLDYEPSYEDILKETPDDLSSYDEVVFCGYGEPTLRLDIIKSLSGEFRKRGAKKIRLNTDGLASLREKRNMPFELKDFIDSVSISLNAADEETYNRLCKPGFPQAFSELIKFIEESKKYIKEVVVSAVAVPELDVERVKDFAENTLKVRFRLRPYNDLG